MVSLQPIPCSWSFLTTPRIRFAPYSPSSLTVQALPGNARPTLNHHPLFPVVPPSRRQPFLAGEPRGLRLLPSAARAPPCLAPRHPPSPAMHSRPRAYVRGFVVGERRERMRGGMGKDLVTQVQEKQ